LFFTMAPLAEPTASSPPDPTAPTFDMPEHPRTSIPESGEPVVEPLVNGHSKQANPPRSKKEKHASSSAVGTSESPSNAAPGEKAGQEQLSNKELKLKQKAEKQAKRAAQKASQDAQVAEQSQQSQQSQQQQQYQYPQQSSGGQRRPSATGKTQAGQAVKITDMPAHHRRTADLSAKSLPVRPLTITTAQAKEPDAEKKPYTEKKVAMFSHLYNKDRRSTIAGVSREIHPAVLTLGIQLRDYVICGGNARCVATLLAFKKVIQSYTTPPSVALPRHLTTHLSHQISYLSTSRPLSTSQGNSIRWLKKLVVELDPKISDPDARDFLCKSIDLFIREKVTLADEVIAREASKKIVHGDIVLVYAKSSVVEKSLLAAHADGKHFCVVVADSRPLFEGKNLARCLARAGLAVQYCLLTGLGSLSRQVTKCFLGASAMMGNGSLYSRAGTAMVAMMAKHSGGIMPGSGAVGSVPVIVLCESVKFSSRVALDSIVGNELGDADALIEYEADGIFTPAAHLGHSAAAVAAAAAASSKKGKGAKVEAEDDDDAMRRKKIGLEGWTDLPNLQLLNLMYDVTPAEYLDTVITELGTIPPSAVSAVNGVWGGEA
jgi:translation initiation factor eIF-2B subunit delta